MCKLMLCYNFSSSLLLCGTQRIMILFITLPLILFILGHSFFHQSAYFFIHEQTLCFIMFMLFDHGSSFWQAIVRKVRSMYCVCSSSFQFNFVQRKLGINNSTIMIYQCGLCRWTQLLPRPQLIFSFQNLVFWNLFEFSVAEISFKSISPKF